MTEAAAALNFAGKKKEKKMRRWMDHHKLLPVIYVCVCVYIFPTFQIKLFQYLALVSIEYVYVYTLLLYMQENYESDQSISGKALLLHLIY